MPLMMCPNCQASMQAVQRSGVEFDMCPTCRGIWLDRGELEKLMGMAREPEAEAPRGQQQYSAPQPPRDDYRRDDSRRGYDDDAKYRDDGHKYDKYGRKKKRGMDIFDIFD